MFANATGSRPSTMNRAMRSGSVRTTSRQPESDSPPRTPPESSSHRYGKMGRHPRPSVRETFLDDFNPANDSGDERDPHDLSLSPKHAARTSIVDNMLLSLDQFSSGTSVLDDYRLFNSVFESDKYTRTSQDSVAQRRYRGHTFSSSISSDADCNYDETTGRYGTQTARDRQSNSSSTNYHSSLKRYGSTRSRDGIGSRGQVYDYRTVPGSAGAGSRAPRKSSKGSAASNLDFGPPISKRQAETTTERRSASFDYGTRKPYMNFPNPPAEYDPYDAIDAAPTPSIPGGPGKYNSSSQGDHTGPINGQASRRNSVKSSRTNPPRKHRPDNIGTAAIRTRDHDLANLLDTDLDPPPAISSSLDPPAPSPTISFNKPIFPPPPEPTPVKERTGFFRRVFGSSRSPAASPSDTSPLDVPFPQETDSKDANGASTDVKGRKQLVKTTPGVATPVRERTPQVVNKKSSFFRRRKKSVVEHAPPPIVLPQELSSRVVNVMKPEPSPVSSLRKVMNPYLADASPNNSTPAVDYSTESSDWSIVANDPENRKPDSAPAKKQRGSVLSPKEGFKGKYSLYPVLAKNAHDTSFLGASSGDEESVAKSSDLEATPLAHQQRDRAQPDDATESRESDQNSVGTEKPVALSQDNLEPPNNTRPTSLSPVAENFPQKDTAPREHSEEISPPGTKTAHIGGLYDSTLWNNESDGPSKMSTPVVGKDSPRASMSEMSNYYTASNTPIVAPPPERISQDGLAEGDPDTTKDVSSHDPDSGDREQAKKLFESQDQFVGNELAAAWLGGPDRAKIRKAYMELFDWSGMNILTALRSLCMRLILKGETQQVDRVLDAFSTRWCGCNPRHGFKAADVVHTICYSLLLLNTDLHLADIEQKMTKAQFIRNTMPTILRVAVDAASDDSDARGKGKVPTQDLAHPSKSQTLPLVESESKNVATEKLSNPPGKLVNRLSRTDLSVKISSDPDNEVGPLVNAPFYGSMKGWEQQLETVLRDFYTAIQKQKLPLHGAQAEREAPRTASSAMLGPNLSSGLRRTPSTVSKSGSDIYPRGRSADSRYGTARWSSKPRSRARLYPPSTLGSSRTSLDDQSSLWSPSGSSTWSKYSLGKLTSASVNSFDSDYPRGDYQQSIGFANALSQAIIREDSAHSIASSEDTERTGLLLEDETLQLAGAPWAKEGSLKHKHHLDSLDKRAKDRNWNECFAVIQQGWMRLFSFNASAKSVRQKTKLRHPGGVIVGGGNWTENAEETWKFLLRQSIASALPPPGYSKSRPHVWALSLPNGAVHLFQAGTPEIVREFVSSANYWSARLSKEPLIGGISNIEYGWSDAIINSALIETNRTPPSSSGARPSIQSSIRSSLDQQGVRPRLPADRVHISDWAPPQQSMMAANLPEADQLGALRTYVKNVEDELQRHNELRSVMVLAFSPRHPNGIKAMANWERKSSYLLREIVKFRTYIDSLQNALDLKNKIYSAREESNPAE